MVYQYRKAAFIAALIIIAFGFNACKDNSQTTAPNTYPNMSSKAHPLTAASFGVKYLVSDTAEFTGVRIDANLVNAWGIAARDGDFWIGTNGAGVGDVYEPNGKQERSPITIPSRTAASGGVPTGTVNNNTEDFAIPSVGVSKIIFAGEDGIISAWKDGGSAVMVAQSVSPDGVYKGIAKATSGGKHYLYATDFHNNKIDVYDKKFAHVSGMSFTDPAMASGFAPFGIANIGGMLFVSYAMQKAPANHDDQSGPGNGYVDIYNPDGTLVKRFASQGTLNSPWGMAHMGDGFGEFSNAVLVGNFGDGSISVFDKNGNLLGQLKGKDGNLLVVDGLWGIIAGGFGDRDEERHEDHDKLYFTAGPNGEAHGAFGYIQLK